MKIHSSSLTLSQIGSNQTASKNNGLPNNELSVTKDAPNKAYNQPSTPEEIKNTLANTNLNNSYTSNNIIKPTDSRTLRAISAYNKEANAPLQDQRAQLITGIDAYA
jgi:hypothetical protein